MDKKEKRVDLLADPEQSLCPLCGRVLVEGECDFLVDFHSLVCWTCGEKARSDDEYYVWSLDVLGHLDDQ